MRFEVVTTYILGPDISFVTTFMLSIAGDMRREVCKDGCFSTTVSFLYLCQDSLLSSVTASTCGWVSSKTVLLSLPFQIAENPILKFSDP